MARSKKGAAATADPAQKTEAELLSELEAPDPDGSAGDPAAEQKPPAAEEKPGAGEEPKAGDAGSGDDGGDDGTPGPSPFENLTLADLKAIADPEERTAAMQGWFDQLSAEEKAALPWEQRKAAEDAARSERDKRAQERERAEGDFQNLQQRVTGTRDAVKQLLIEAGRVFHERVKDNPDKDVPFQVSEQEFNSAMDAFADAQVPLKARDRIAAVVSVIQDEIEALGEPVNATDVDRFAEAAEKAGKSMTWAYVREVADRARAQQKAEDDAEWKKREKGLRAAIRTELEKGGNYEPSYRGSGSGPARGINLEDINSSEDWDKLPDNLSPDQLAAIGANGR